jgi:hypothetical protein
MNNLSNTALISAEIDAKYTGDQTINQSHSAIFSIIDFTKLSNLSVKASFHTKIISDSIA